MIRRLVPICAFAAQNLAIEALAWRMASECSHEVAVQCWQFRTVWRQHVGERKGDTAVTEK
jgi:hypothetical protein